MHYCLYDLPTITTLWNDPLAGGGCIADCGLVGRVSFPPHLSDLPLESPAVFSPALGHSGVEGRLVRSNRTAALKES